MTPIERAGQEQKADQMYRHGFAQGQIAMREAALKVCRVSLEYEWAASMIETLPIVEVEK